MNTCFSPLRKLFLGNGISGRLLLLLDSCLLTQIVMATVIAFFRHFFALNSKLVIAKNSRVAMLARTSTTQALVYWWPWGTRGPGALHYDGHIIVRPQCNGNALLEQRLPTFWLSTDTLWILAWWIVSKSLKLQNNGWESSWKNTMILLAAFGEVPWILYEPEFLTHFFQKKNSSRSIVNPLKCFFPWQK